MGTARLRTIEVERDPMTKGRRGLTFIAGDFAYRDGRIHLRKTGNSAPVDRHLLAEVAGWLLFTVLVRLVGLFASAKPGPRPRIWFTPDRPHPRYNVRAAATWAGMRLARSAGEADVVFAFEDVTSGPRLPPAPTHVPALNWRCTDISKSRVAAAFAEAFGHPLAVDPATWVGDAVEKGEVNGAHDGRIVTCPRPALPGHAYQRVVDAVDADGMAIDLRTQCIGGRPVQVWIKARPAATRFLPPNAWARPVAPATVFSREERARLATFLQLMGADWCALDVLRDRDGRIYVVDVNKTDAGPITALSLRDKLAATAINARALRGLVGEARRPARSGRPAPAQA